MYLWICLIVASFAFGVQSETDCEAHRRSSSGGPVLWDIQCDEDGNYEPMSCIDDEATPKWCACYAKDGHQVKRPSKNYVSCDCPVREYEDRKAGKSDCEVLECKANGEYETKQCCRVDNEMMCHCVDGDGKPTSETSTNPPC